jgi:threonine dehydrogenase-like Zn-dependent dehydrogenase
MKVIRLNARSELRLREEPLPIPGVGEQLLQVKAVGICGFDLLLFSEDGIGNVQLGKSLIRWKDERRFNDYESFGGLTWT